MTFYIILVELLVLCTLLCPDSLTLYENDLAHMENCALLLEKWVNSYCMLQFYVI